ncbi:MAG: class I SAM-dependent methyltransferase [Saprospiraceae bacterium]|nr:class I SAM-dependent methyltransferase [Saprospiraceae bacterium]
MNSKLFHSIKAAFSFYWRAQTVYNIHSPKVYDFTQAVIEDKRYFYIFDDAEKIRRQLLNNKTSIAVTDFGAGSRKNIGTNNKRISEIAKTSLSTPSQCRFLFRLINWLQPKVILELGTSLGISMLYQSSAAKQAQVFTLEGDPNIANIARNILQHSPNKQIKCITGNFKETLPALISNIEKIDYALLDGNHQYAPTLEYFEMLLPKMSTNGLLVFDDIYWSEEMTAAWEEIKLHPQVYTTIDVFDYGIVLFSELQRIEKQHFSILPARYKPFILGFWR